MKEAGGDIVVARPIVEAIAEDGIGVGADLEGEDEAHQRLAVEAGELKRGGLGLVHEAVRGVRGHHHCAWYRRAGDAILLPLDLPVAGDGGGRGGDVGSAHAAAHAQSHDDEHHTPYGLFPQPGPSLQPGWRTRKREDAGRMPPRRGALT